MFLKSYFFLFFFFLSLGTLISVSANNWFTVWLGLEINLMSMIPIMINKVNQLCSEASIKYFITQALASVMLIFSSTINLFMSSMNLEMINIMLIIALLMKSGMAPFHTWFPQVISSMNWIQSLTLFTWQKVAPLLLLTSSASIYITAAAISSAVIGSISGFNQTIMKLLLTFSSVSHSGWMVLACSINFKLWMIYFMIYSLLVTSIITLICNKYSKVIEINYINQSLFFKITWVSLIFSLGGLPPLLGFLSKLLVINKLTTFSMFFTIAMLILSSLISLFWYLRMIYSTSMLNHSMIKINFMSDKNTISSLIYTATFLNIMAPSLMFILT
uniref:NADH dehydrogenase subunit 2 n=1 Tax=Cyphoderus aff. similis TaxID=2901280 RepID=UPI001EDF3608|nr:NADH dehydrogenase subunit 2 [Cyphoderus aff. similis]UIR97912.1 NADH dehydrogenase subunit 2 [Cyphoderus aff. similis]